jgi:hypothetical protein
MGSIRHRVWSKSQTLLPRSVTALHVCITTKSNSGVMSCFDLSLMSIPRRRSSEQGRIIVEYSRPKKSMVSMVHWKLITKRRLDRRGKGCDVRHQ